MTTADTIRATLGPIAGLADEAIDVAEAALLLASIDHPATDLKIYRDHLKTLADAVNDAAMALNLDGNAAAPEAMAGVLGQVIAGEFRYVGDEERRTTIWTTPTSCASSSVAKGFLSPWAFFISPPPARKGGGQRV